MDNKKHEYVDLGLPSGTLWATENIKDSEGNDLYFAWGETQGYTSGQVGTDKYFAFEGDNADYKFGIYGIRYIDYGMTKYNRRDGKTELDAEDDAATVNWGSNWRIPTKADFKELLENTTSAWTQVDGANGILFTSTVNANTLFFPAVGYTGEGEVSNVGYYWSVSLNDEYVSTAWILGFGGWYCKVYSSSRCYGFSVRPVYSKNKQYNEKKSIKEATEIDKFFHGILCFEEKLKCNVYYLAFRYEKDVNVVKVTANQLANELLGNTDDIVNLKWGNERKEDDFGISDQGFTKHLWFDGKDYVIEFADDPHFFNIYKYVKDEEEPNKWYGEHIIARNIPWICIKIEDWNGNEIYNLNNEI